MRTDTIVPAALAAGHCVDSPLARAERASGD